MNLEKVSDILSQSNIPFIFAGNKIIVGPENNKSEKAASEFISYLHQLVKKKKLSKQEMFKLTRLVDQMYSPETDSDQVEPEDELFIDRLQSSKEKRQVS